MHHQIDQILLQYNKNQSDILLTARKLINKSGIEIKSYYKF